MSSPAYRSRANRRSIRALLVLVLAQLAIAAMTACNPDRVAGIDYTPKAPCPTNEYVMVPDSTPVRVAPGVYQTTYSLQCLKPGTLPKGAR